MAARKQLAPNFYDDEFACNCGCGEKAVSPELVRRLQLLRQAVGVPIRVTSGVRCVAHNKAVGGAVNSQHLLGLAADITAPGVSLRDLYDHAELLGFSGLGVAPYGNYLHVDVREGTKARWSYDARNRVVPFEGPPEAITA